MSRKILFINFSACSYKNEAEFFEQQAAVLYYKAELALTNEVFYLANNNLRLDRIVNGISLHSRNYHNPFFLIYAVLFARRQNFEVVIVHGTDFLIPAILIKKLISTLVILQHHGESTFLKKKAALFYFADTCIDGYFFNGLGVAEDFVKKGFSANKIFEVTEGTTDFKLIPFNSEKAFKKIVSVGRLNKDKNTLVLLKAIKILKTIRTDFVLHLFYSSFQQEQELKQFCEENGIGDKVIFRGKVSPREIENEMNSADIFLSASKREAGGYALIESLACGIFPVVSSIPSFEYLLRDLNEKKIFDPNDERQLAKDLDQVLNINIDASTRRKIRLYFEEKASAAAIARQIEKALAVLFSK